MAREFGHYTTVQGLMGIIESEALWATNINYLNDEQEYRHALALLDEIKPRIATLLVGERDEQRTKFMSLASEEINNFNTDEGHNLYTISFSIKTDLLSQWRGYTPNNDGYCIVFDARAIFRDLFQYSIGAKFLRCVYDDRKKMKLLTDTFIARWEEYRKVKAERERESIISDLASEVLTLASHTKHGSFSEESEFRIVVDPAMQMIDQDILFRRGRSSIVPYISIPAPRRYIRKIIVGPNVHRALAMRSLEEFSCAHFDTGDFRKLVLENSAIPYRNW